MDFLNFVFENSWHFFGMILLIIVIGIFVDNVITNITNMIAVIFNSFKRDYRVINYNLPNVSEVKGNLGEAVIVDEGEVEEDENSNRA